MTSEMPGIGPGLMRQIRSDITVSGKPVTDKPAAGSTKTAPKAGDSPKSEKATNAKPSTEKSNRKKIARSRIRLVSRQVDFARSVEGTAKSGALSTLSHITL